MSARPAPTLERVECVPAEDAPGWLRVTPVWKNVDRPDAFSWVLPPKDAHRLVRAVKDGKACPNPRIVTDVMRKTYVLFDLVVTTKNADKDLERIGF